MNRMTKAATSAVAAVAIAATGVTLASPSNAAQPHRNGVDAKFLRSNEQVNLAEIAVAKIVIKRSHNKDALALARRTSADHKMAEKLDKALAKRIGVTLPTKPNAQQQALAKALMTSKHLNRDYFVAQIAGHKQSIMATKYEIKHGIRPRVVGYAKVYLKIAEMHLKMAEKDLAALNHHKA